MGRPADLSPNRSKEIARAIQLALVCIVTCSACDSSKSQSPIAPSAPSIPSPADPAPAQYSLTGQVLCETSPIPASQIEILAGVDSGTKVIADAEGRYTFAGLAPGELTLRASASGYVAQTTVLVLDRNKVADFRLPEATEDPESVVLSGVVVSVAPGGASSRALPAARVSIASGKNAGRSATTDQDGRYRIADLSPEGIILEASASGHISESKPIDLSGDTTFDVRLARAEPAPSVLLNGRIVDVLTDAGVGGVTVKGDGLTAQPSDGHGAFTANALADGPNPRSVAFSGSGVIERLTYVPVPGQDLLVSLITATFDLAAFDQMFRDPGLRRWTSAPPLAIERRALQYTDVNMSDGVAVDDIMTASEVDGLVGDLEWALPQLTGGSFTAFRQVSQQTAEPGASVRLLNIGQITVARVVGLEAGTGRWGWGRWLYDETGAVMGGIVMLDRDFERRASPFLRALRSHELGHALGYGHVSGRESVMDASGRIEPTPFDRDAARIAFQRKPGSRSPDVDPEPSRLVKRSGGSRWSEPLH